MKTEKEIQEALNASAKKRLEQLKNNEVPIEDIKPDDEIFINGEPITDDLPEELRTPVEELNPIKVKRKFLGIWIPREIWLSEDLTMQEKVFIVEINSLDNDKGCFASNAYFGKFFGLSVTRVSHIVNSLVEKEWVTSHLTYKENSKEVDRRTLKIKEKRKEVLNNNIT